MNSCCPVWLSSATSVLSAATAATALIAAPASAADLVIDSGPLVRHELFRSDGPSALIWEELAFTFQLPNTATGDGLLRLFAGGDLNNIGVDWIDVTAGPFGGRTLLGTYAFPVSDVHFTACEKPPHSNPAGCPLPEPYRVACSTIPREVRRWGMSRAGATSRCSAPACAALSSRRACSREARR
jgi:hypothetical protein